MLIICGPTGTGKTRLALEMASTLGGELISADSRQVYRGMDIGTGKDLPPKAGRDPYSMMAAFGDASYVLQPFMIDGVRLWMYDVVSPAEPFSVSHFASLAGAVRDDILARGRLPIVVGGTGLYINALIARQETFDIGPDPVLRERLGAQSVSQLQRELQVTDRRVWESLNESDRQNPRRLVRKIEIAMAARSGRIPSGTAATSPGDVHILGLTAPTSFLYDRIDARVDQRMEQGMLGEIARLASLYDWSTPAFAAFAYKEWSELLVEIKSGTLDERDPRVDAAVRQWKYDEHGYARKQMTWFRRMPGVSWVDISKPEAGEQIQSLIRSWYT